MDFSTNEITPKKEHGHNVNVLTIEITQKKVNQQNYAKKSKWHNVDFSTSRIT